MNEIRVLEEDEFLCDYDAEEEKEIYEDNEMLDDLIKLQKHYGSKENGIILPKGTKLRLVEKATKQNSNYSLRIIAKISKINNNKTTPSYARCCGGVVTIFFFFLYVSHTREY